MNMNQQVLTAALQSDVPVLLVGKPGIGKTASITKYATDNDLTLEIVIGSLCDPTDFGVPVPHVTKSRKEVLRLPPRWAQTLADSKGGILFLDEITNCPPSIQSALLRVVHDRYVGDLYLPPSVRIVAACNPPDEATEGYWLAPPLANRFAHLYIDVEVAAWCDDFPGYWGAPPKTVVSESEWAIRRAEVASYIRRNPGSLLSLPKSEAEAGGPWPSPRSWDHASRMMASSSKGSWLPILASTVGEGPAAGYMTWLKELNLPDPEKLLAGKARLPQRTDELFISLSAVTAAIEGNCTKDRWLLGWKLLEKVSEAGLPDMAVMSAGKLVHLRPGNTPFPKEIRNYLGIMKEAGITN